MALVKGLFRLEVFPIALIFSSFRIFAWNEPTLLRLKYSCLGVVLCCYVSLFFFIGPQLHLITLNMIANVFKRICCMVITGLPGFPWLQICDYISNSGALDLKTSCSLFIQKLWLMSLIHHNFIIFFQCTTAIVNPYKTQHYWVSGLLTQSSISMITTVPPLSVLVMTL